MKIGLLLGAGFSYDLGMPIAKELTEVFLGLFDVKNTKSLALALSNNQRYGIDRPINKKAIVESLDLLLSYKAANGQNYEALLAELQALSEAPGRPQTDSLPRSAGLIAAKLSTDGPQVAGSCRWSSLSE